MASMPFLVPCTPRMLIGAHRFSLNTSYCTAQQGRETLAMQAGNTGLSSPGNRQASWSRLTGQFIHETGCATSYWTYGLCGRGTGGNCLISFAAAEGVGNEDIGYKPYPSAIGETRLLDHSGSSAILDPADPFLWIQRPNTEYVQVLWQKKNTCTRRIASQPCAWLPAHAAGADRGFGEGGLSFRVTVTATNGLPLERPTPSIH